MKRIIFALLLVISISSLTSCHKGGINLFAGDYSFKTSGEVFISAQSGTNVVPAMLNINLANSVGQLNISAANDKSDNVVVVINNLNGDVFTTTGSCEGKDIIIDEFECTTLPFSVTTLFTGDFKIKVSAIGQMYDDNMIVFDVFCNGSASIGSVTYKVKDKDIKMVAYRN